MKEYLKTHWIKLIVRFIIIAAILTFDMITKVYFAQKTHDANFIPGFISFKYVENTGAAFGILGSHTILLIVVSILFVVFFTFWDITNKEGNWLSEIGYAFVIAGAVGNLYDRLILGYVRDFINFDFMTWGVFNIADTFITIGCFVYIIYFIVLFVKQKRNKKSDV